jgi:hypothetical protein
VNYFVYPLQLGLLIPIYRAGEMLFHQPPTPLSIPLMFERFGADFWQFLHDYGMIAVHGVAVWCLLAPLVAAALYYSLRPPLRALGARIRTTSEVELPTP